MASNMVKEFFWTRKQDRSCTKVHGKMSWEMEMAPTTTTLKNITTDNGETTRKMAQVFSHSEVDLTTGNGQETKLQAEAI